MKTEIAADHCGAAFVHLLWKGNTSLNIGILSGSLTRGLSVVVLGAPACAQLILPA
jgi:hypothetical protein